MELLGEKIRLARLLNKESGRLLGITLDHAIARGVLTGIIDVKATLAKVVAGSPDAVTLHKGIAEECLPEHAGKVALILKCSSFSPYHPNYDTWVTQVDEAVRLGADAVSFGVIIGSEKQSEQLRNLGSIARDAKLAGMPLIAHIYPRGELIKKEDRSRWENIAYAVRVGAELGVDIIKTHYTGDPDSFAKVVRSCPTRVVIAGGVDAKDDAEFLRMTKDAMDAGACGVAYGRYVWDRKNTANFINALKVIIHKNGDVETAMQALQGE